MYCTKNQYCQAINRFIKNYYVLFIFCLKIGSLRETQAQYVQVLRLAKALALNFQRVVTTQRVLGDAFGELSQRSGVELGDEFTCNAEIQRVLSKNGDQLLGKLITFIL